MKNGLFITDINFKIRFLLETYFVNFIVSFRIDFINYIN